MNSSSAKTEYRRGDLTEGSITKGMLLFALPLMAGNILQQMYNIADTWVVGRFLGADALAAVGSAYTLMVFLTSIILGLCMGSGAAVSMDFGSGDKRKMRGTIFMSFVLIAGASILLNVIVYLLIDPILALLQIPTDVLPLIKTYLLIIFAGILATFLYNYFACVLRAVGNSVTPLVFLGISSVLNVGLDLLFVLVFEWGVGGVAFATVLAQYVSGIGILVYTIARVPELIPTREDRKFSRDEFKRILNLSSMTCLQQSIMNFGILMIQGLVNSFGTVVMAAFAAAVKIDSFAYMPVQDFGNAFSTFVAQNFGAKKDERIRFGVRSALITTSIFSLAISLIIVIFARPLMAIFVGAEVGIIAAGVTYLRIEGACYIGIGILFLLYGYYRAIDKPFMSVILTIASLGTRVALAYALAPIPSIGVLGIWAAIPIGWALADTIGIAIYARTRRHT